MEPELESRCQLAVDSGRLSRLNEVSESCSYDSVFR
jgi:hypothetical protein